MKDKLWMIAGMVTGVGLMLYLVAFMAAMVWITIHFTAAL